MKFKNNKLIVDLENGSEKIVVCDCGGENFREEGKGRWICLSCNNQRN